MKILITGGTGLLGRALVDASQDRFEMVATYKIDYKLKDTGRVKYRKLDIRDATECSKLFNEIRPDVTVHTAGIGNPDYAEKHKKETREINISGTANVLDNCERRNSKLIYISSNAVYNGESAPYSENDKASPISFYGEIKLEGERFVKKAKIPHAIVRPILMYGWNYSFGRHNIVTLAISKLQKGEKMFVFEDVYVNPLFAQSCAEAIWQIVEKSKYETFNIAGKDRMSIFELVTKMAEIFKLDAGLVVPVKQGFFKELLKRPRDTSYNTGKMKKLLGLEPVSVIEGLRLMKESRES